MCNGTISNTNNLEESPSIRCFAFGLLINVSILQNSNVHLPYNSKIAEDHDLSTVACGIEERASDAIFIGNRYRREQCRTPSPGGGHSSCGQTSSKRSLSNRKLFSVLHVSASFHDRCHRNHGQSKQCSETNDDAIASTLHEKLVSSGSNQSKDLRSHACDKGIVACVSDIVSSYGVQQKWSGYER